jgi:hypothetical protein
LLQVVTVIRMRTEPLSLNLAADDDLQQHQHFPA